MKRGLLVLTCGIFGLAGQAFAAFNGTGTAPHSTAPLGLFCLGLFLIGTAGILRSRQEKMTPAAQGIEGSPRESRPKKAAA